MVGSREILSAANRRCPVPNQIEMPGQVAIKLRFLDLPSAQRRQLLPSTVILLIPFKTGRPLQPTTTGRMGTIYRIVSAEQFCLGMPLNRHTSCFSVKIFCPVVCSSLTPKEKRLPTALPLLFAATRFLLYQVVASSVFAERNLSPSPDYLHILPPRF